MCEYVAKCEPPMCTEIMMARNFDAINTPLFNITRTTIDNSLLIQHRHLCETHKNTLDIDEIFWLVYNCILFVCILGGNILTFIAIRTCRRLRSTISNLFISSLAISDFVVGVSIPYHMAFYIAPDLGSHKHPCLTRFFLIIFACSVSIFTLISISFDRYIAIVYPLQYRCFMTRRVAYMIIIINWILGVGVAVIPMFWNSWDTSRYCEFDEILPIWYMAGIITPGYLLILIVMSLLYGRIMLEASRQAQQLRNSICSQKSIAERFDWKSIQVVLCIMGSFSICWLPYFIVACGQMLSIFHVTSALYKGTLALAMTNSGLNPLIYAWKNENLRRAFIKLLRCKSPNTCPHELSQCSARFRAPVKKQITSNQSKEHVETAHEVELKVYHKVEAAPASPQHSRLSVSDLSDQGSSSGIGLELPNCIGRGTSLCKFNQKGSYNVIDEKL